MNTITPTRIKTARAIAIGADFIQIVMPQFFAEGFLSPFEDVLDVVVCLVLTKLIGWHYSFLPSFALKVVPVVDLVPSWTLAVLLATRQGSAITPQTTEVYSEPPHLPPRIPQSTSQQEQ